MSTEGHIWILLKEISPLLNKIHFGEYDPQLPQTSFKTMKMIPVFVDLKHLDTQGAQQVGGLTHPNGNLTES